MIPPTPMTTRHETGRATATGILLSAVFLLLSFHTEVLALPNVVHGGELHVYATFPTWPGGISFDASDQLYVGNFNDNNPPYGPADIWRIDPADSSVNVCNDNADDPDAVFVDIDGILADAGDVLVGGQLGTTVQGYIGKFGGCQPATVVTLDSCLANIAEFAQDDSGRLYVVNYGASGSICAYDPGAATWLKLIDGVGNGWIAIDGSDLYVTSGTTISKYDRNGVLVDSVFATGIAVAVGPAGGPFDGIVVSRPDQLVIVDPVTKVETPILTGPDSDAQDVAFNAAGDMFVSQRIQKRVLHVTAGATTGVAAGSPERAEGLTMQVAPNPFRGRTTISFGAPVPERVRLTLVDIRGREVMTVWDGPGTMAPRELILASNLASGVYFLRARSARSLTTQRIVHMR